MADVTGPISSLPGSFRKPPAGQSCDEHPGVPAVIRLQGETDSFGCEMYDLCQACDDARRSYLCSEAGQAEAAAERSGVCEWCKSAATDLRNARDYDEGMSGPVYRVCGACIQRVNEEAAAELEAMGDNCDCCDWDDGDE